MNGVHHPAVSFQHSDPPWRVPIGLPIRSAAPHDVESGDIIYTRRPKGYQRLGAVAGDTWRHMGVATMVAGSLWVLEMAPTGYSARPLTSIISIYDTVALQRLEPCTTQCRARLLNRIAADMNTPTQFHTKTELASIGLLSLSRILPRRSMLEACRTRLASLLGSRREFRTRSICSTPVARNLGQLCEQHRAVLDVWSPKIVSPRQATPHRHHQLALPDDVWRALQAATTSYWLKKDGMAGARVTSTFDLQKQTERRPANGIRIMS